MNLWRLEWLRLVRTRRLPVLLGVYLFFGITGPLTARYLPQILERLSTGGMRVEVPAPRPADGVEQFTNNAAQLGLLVVVLVTGSALAFDARREMAVFLRTRVGHVREILIPAYVVNATAAVAALIAGSMAAWYETAVLLGGLPPARMILGIALGALFLAFAVAAVALAGSLVKGIAATAGLTLGAMLTLGLLGNLGGPGQWLPTTLLTAMPGLVGGVSPAEYLPAALVTVMATVGALAAAAEFGSRREL